MAQCNAALEPTESEILERTSDENMRHMHQGEELRRLIGELPDTLIVAAGFHRLMLGSMSQYQQICFLDYLRRDEKLWLFLNSGLESDIREFIEEFGDTQERYYGFQVLRDHSWDKKFDRPKDSWVFEPQMTKTGAIEHFRTIVSRRGVVVTLQDRSDNGQSPGPYLRLKYQKRGRGEVNGWAIEEKAVKCITPFEDFCYPPDATVTIGYRLDGCIDFKVFAKEMPRSPVLHWIFPDPKRDDLDPAYRDFLWWL